jgi:anti-anti-sigma regulatory factor
LPRQITEEIALPRKKPRKSEPDPEPSPDGEPPAAAFGQPAGETPAPDSPPPESAGAAPEAPPANYLEVARSEKLVIIRPNGLGNMKVAMGLMDFTAEMLRNGYTHFVFDLSACKGLDSTFMGAMVGLAAAAQEEGGLAAVVNASHSNVELLQIVGADKFLQLRGDYRFEEIETERLAPPPPSAARRLELVKQAHESLVDIDKRNEARFGAFLRQLSTELADKP